MSEASGVCRLQRDVAIMVQKDTELNDLSGLRIDGMQL